ncbi:hypothetical protein BHE90_012618 [Fusarium euwallaceae]|uniref:Uncharacterized protein n=1 Tax=Fusarium euwallaceae TaxID=1147111 RepID=A0A430LB49_9HYPO|nr:hypothetical protein BHE90_012618 [Fusarium euwallaceae]
MAQGHVVQGQLAGGDELLGLSSAQRHRFHQYEKIVRFSDTVLSGKHPSIKPSANLIATAQSSIHPIDVTIENGASNYQPDKSQYSVAKAQQPGASSSGLPAIPPSTTKANKPYGSGNVEINPIFLEKSDDLVKAEFQLQRQRLERTLRDEVEQRRAAVKNAAQGEPIPDFDLNDVLTKALKLVEATAGPAADDDNPATTNLETASDSFDDNTFYSSQHNTPSSVHTSRVRNESEEARGLDTTESQPPSNSRNAAISRIHPIDVDLEMSEPSATRPRQTYTNPSTNAGASSINNTSQVERVPGLTSFAEDRIVSAQDTGIGPSHSEDSSNTEIERHRGSNRSNARRQPRENYIDSRPPSPLMRVHERSAQASPLTAARRAPMAAEATSNSSRGTPAQVAALRNEPITVTSPESSPQGGGAAEKKKGKKKKRKADRQAPEAEPTPYIKPEPRSPSPMSAPSYIRPNKRQRYTQRQPEDPNYEDVRYERQTGDYPPEPLSSRLGTDDRMPIGYDRPSLSSRRAVSTAVPGSTVYRREYTDDRYAPGGPYAVEHPPLVSAHHPGEQSVGRASSQVRPSEGHQRPSWPYHGSYETSSVSTRPDGDVFMAPPRPPPTRIIVDAFGREYIEPPRPTVIRHSVAPPARSGEPEIIYERAAPRALPKQTGMETYEEGGTVYRRPSPTYIPRRVVTQPEYISQDYRDHRPREYPARPMAPPGEPVEIMAPPGRRRVEEGPRDYITRAASVRPADPVWYEVARDYGRVQSVRPEGAVRQYATSVHPESRREAAQPYAREYGTLPVEQGAVRREYSARPPLERYYNQPMRGGEDIAFIEQPRGAAQEIVYADDGRREVYR